MQSKSFSRSDFWSLKMQNSLILMFFVVFLIIDCIRGLYPEFDGNLNTRLASAPAHTADSPCKPILKKREDLGSHGEENLILVEENLDKHFENESVLGKKKQKIPQIISQGWLRSPETISTSRLCIPHQSGMS